MTDLWLLGHVLDRLRELADRSVHMSVTSPPYFGLRDYGTAPQDWPEVTFAPMPGLPPMTIPAMRCSLGNEPDPWSFVGHMVLVFREVRRVLRDDGTLWLNLGDSYAANAGTRSWGADKETKGPALVGTSQFVRAAVHDARTPPEGCKPKDLIGIPWRVAFALQADGWYLRAACPWVKRACMPSSVQDRPTTGIEHVFLLTKSERYFYDVDAVRVAPATKPQRRLTRRDEHAKGAVAAPGGKVRPPNYGVMDEPGVNNTPANGRNRRDTDWFFGSLEAILDGGEGMLSGEDGEPLALVMNPRPFAEAHFATMPHTLVEPCILAGTSERGCCAECGAPWKRVVERVTDDTAARDTAATKLEHTQTGGRTRKTANHESTLVRGANVTTGWRPTCGHEGDPVPCTVLDIFGGAGTTPMVARRLRRSFIYVELNPEYREIAWRRFVGDAPLFNRVPA